MKEQILELMELKDRVKNLEGEITKYMRPRETKHYTLDGYVYSVYNSIGEVSVYKHPTEELY